MTENPNNISLDVFAETNPAFCALVITTYISAYQKKKNSALPITFLPFALPIILSGDIKDSFYKTSDSTGLARWISKTPHVLLQLPDRVQACLEMTRGALQFALHYQMLEIDEHARISDVQNGVSAEHLKKIKMSHFGNNAHRLGSWMGDLSSDVMAYNLLGLEI
jgi:hypothetical protein